MGEQLARLTQAIERATAKMPDPPMSFVRYRNPHDHDSEFDIHGKIEKRIDLGLAFRTFPGLVERMRQVPARAVVEEGEDDDGPFSLVTCPCGQNPIVRSELSQCEGCERHYLRLERSAWVLYGDMPVPPRKPGATAVD